MVIQKNNYKGLQPSSSTKLNVKLNTKLMKWITIKLLNYYIRKVDNKIKKQDHTIILKALNVMRKNLKDSIMFIEAINN